MRVRATNIKGFDKVMSNLNKEIAGMRQRSMQGLIECGIMIRRDMDLRQPLIPVDTGNMRSSWYMTPRKLLHKMWITIGFTANYALIVHERIQPGINWKRPGSGPKFFEAAIKRNISEIRSIIHNNISWKTAKGVR